MFSLNARSLFIYSFAIILFMFHAFADARLVRGGGRGTHADSSNTIYTLVDNSYINTLGLDPDYVTIEEERFNSGLDELVSTPADCEAIFGGIDDLNNAKMFGGFVDEPCYYEAYEDDARLAFSGFGRALFEMASSADVIWTLSRAGFADVVITDDISAIVGSEVLLDALMPAALVPGEYLIDLDIVFHSGPDNTFYRGVGDSIDDQYCEEVMPMVVECHLQELFGSDTISFGSRYQERLVILAAAAPIDEPAILGLVLIGLIGFRRRK